MRAEDRCARICLVALGPYYWGTLGRDAHGLNRDCYQLCLKRSAERPCNWWQRLTGQCWWE